jgi:hypothetical protein
VRDHALSGRKAKGSQSSRQLYRRDGDRFGGWTLEGGATGSWPHRAVTLSQHEHGNGGMEEEAGAFDSERACIPPSAAEEEEDGLGDLGAAKEVVEVSAEAAGVLNLLCSDAAVEAERLDGWRSSVAGRWLITSFSFSSSPITITSRCASPRDHATTHRVTPPLRQSGC